MVTNDPRRTKKIKIVSVTLKLISFLQVACVLHWSLPPKFLFFPFPSIFSGSWMSNAKTSNWGRQHAEIARRKKKKKKKEIKRKKVKNIRNKNGKSPFHLTEHRLTFGRFFYHLEEWKEEKNRQRKKQGTNAMSETLPPKIRVIIQDLSKEFFLRSFVQTPDVTLVFELFNWSIEKSIERNVLCLLKNHGVCPACS